MKINLLSSKIYNRIAAGEVVERPFSVVKELVENSIDAGATKIEIEIENGGISCVKITDNGCGIEKSELKKALLPHATSKISSLKDLDNIMSLGFRGEALASIASVSKITIESKPSDQEFGASISADGGEMSDITDSAINNGTIISVNNLFFNTPVREKFLRSEKSEENEITATVARFILGNPTISFKYTVDGKVVYNSFGDGFESAIVCVYGVDALENCFYIDTVKNGIKINGYIGKHFFTKGNRSYQTTFINGRYVVNQTVSSAIANAYSSYLMKRQYPFYVLSISLPSEIVDVNVHPNKLDVRFANNQIVYGSIYSVISKVLDGSSEALNIVSVDRNIKANNTELNTKEINTNYDTHNHVNFDKKMLTLSFSDSKPSTESKSIKFDNEGEYLKNDNNNDIDIFAENKLYLEKLEKQKLELQQKNEEVKQESLVSLTEIKYIGQALNTYLIFEDGIDLYFADQHAAHERILFDKLNLAVKNAKIDTQTLLLPYVINVNSLEYNFLLSKLDVLNSMGIEISEFGRNAFKVSAIPTFLVDINLKTFFDDILSDINELKTFTVNELLDEKLAQKACKSAIKSGDKLSESEIAILLEKLKENIGLKCPHGRPVAIKITRTEIDKWFKRIV
ncbi:MAG: DNA mismatch repair endonuclease MutL [Clostridiales bacterium]|nr:DNA mismatch repair endonuclease MutL [Clostridiales bacterium]